MICFRASNVIQIVFPLQALVEDVCQQTQIAELKLKVPWSSKQVNVMLHQCIISSNQFSLFSFRACLLGCKTKLMDDREGGFAKCSILAIVYLNRLDRQILLVHHIGSTHFTIVYLNRYLGRMEKLNG